MNSKAVLLSAAGLFFAAVVLPLCALIFRAFINDGGVAAESLTSVFHKDVLQSIGNSLIISTAVSLSSVLLGCCFAFLFLKTTILFFKFLRLLLLLPLLLPSYVICVAWNDVWLFAGVYKDFIYSLPAVVFILTTIYTPLAAFIIQAGLKNINARMEEAGMMITSYKEVFFKIVLPLLRPALFSSFILIFILSLSEFAVPSYLSIPVFTTEIFIQFSAFYNYSLAITQSIILTSICLLLLLPEKKYLTKEHFFSFGKKTFRFRVFELRNRTLTQIVVMLYIIFTVLVPVGFLTAQTFSKTGSSFLTIIKPLLPSLKDSFFIGIAGAFMITMYGLIFSWLTVQFKIKFLQTFLLLVFAVPSIVIGISLILFYNTPSLSFIYSSKLIILVAFMARFLFISVKIISDSLQQIPVSYTDAACITGAKPFYVFRRITFPLLGESLFTSFFIILIFCLNELSTIIMIYPPGTSLLPVTIFTRTANAPQYVVSGMSLVSLLFTIVILICMFFGKKMLFNQQWRTSR
ncbi:MAG: iron ABC transporter permease [Chitinophagaceae bacterium]